MTVTAKSHHKQYLWTREQQQSYRHEVNNSKVVVRATMKDQPRTMKHAFNARKVLQKQLISLLVLGQVQNMLATGEAMKTMQTSTEAEMVTEVFNQHRKQ